MFGEAGGADDGGEFVQRFAAAFFNVGWLRRDCFLQVGLSDRRMKQQPPKYSPEILLAAAKAFAKK